MSDEPVEFSRMASTRENAPPIALPYFRPPRHRSPGAWRRDPNLRVRLSIAVVFLIAFAGMSYLIFTQIGRSQ